MAESLPLGRAPLIAFEGIDGAGKTLLSKLLEQRLQDGGVDSVRVRDPGGTEFGELLRSAWEQASQNLEMSARVEGLFFSTARAHLVESRIRPALDQGTVVICDRFTGSTIAYQGADPDLSISDLERLNKLATGGLQPDLVLLLDIPAEQGLARTMGMDPLGNELTVMESRGAAFLGNVRDRYLQLAARDRDRWHVLPGLSEPDVLMNRIWPLVGDLLKRQPAARSG